MLKNSTGQRPTPEPRYLRNDKLLFRAIGEELLILPQQNGIVDLQCLFTLNTTAGFVWEQLIQPSTVTEIGAALTREFMVAEDEATADAAHLIHQLMDEGCVHMVSSGEPGLGTE
jgi:Coenzyme PQQ synthesis protein D (PqqD)